MNRSILRVSRALSDYDETVALHGPGCFTLPFHVGKATGDAVTSWVCASLECLLRCSRLPQAGSSCALYCNLLLPALTFFKLASQSSLPYEMSRFVQAASWTQSWSDHRHSSVAFLVSCVRAVWSSCRGVWQSGMRLETTWTR